MSKKNTYKNNAKGRKAPYIICSIIIVICISASGALFYFAQPCSVCGKKFCFSNHTQGTDLSSSTVKAKKHKVNQTTTQLVSTDIQPETYFNDIYFIGDSRSVALKNLGIDSSHIFAEVGLNHKDAIDKEVVKIAKNKMVSIPEAVKIAAPKIAIVNFGINGARFMGKEDFLSSYESLIDTLITNSPNTIFVIEAILPVGLSYETKTFSNEYLDELNDAILQMAKNKGIFYLGANEVMKNTYNDLKNEYNSGDGLHFTTEGYKIVLDYIRSHAIITTN